MRRCPFSWNWEAARVRTRAPGGMSGVGVREVAGEVAVGVDLGEQVLRLLLDTGDGVRTGDPAHRGLRRGREADEGGGELGGVTALLAVHAVPGGDGLLGALGVVGDGR